MQDNAIQIKRMIGRLRPEEILGLLFGILVGLLMFAFKGQVALTKDLWHLVSRYSIIYFYLWGVLAIFMRVAYGARNIGSLFRDWLPFFGCILVYEFLHRFINIINPNDYHEVLINVDFFIFRAHPTVWLQEFIRPTLTNYLSTVYLSYFLFLPFLATMLYFKKKFFEFRALMLTAVVCLYTGYVGYILVPALPPFMTMSNLYTLNLNGTVAEGILFPFIDSASILRDCFPSLHSAVTAIVLVFAWRFERKLFWMMLPFGLSLFFSTVYLRQHYVIDLIAGWILAGGCLYWVPRFHSFWENRVRRISDEMGRLYRNDGPAEQDRFMQTKAAAKAAGQDRSSR